MKERRTPIPSLLEAGELPLANLAALSLREGRRPRAIYTAHKWFARRLGTVFRALLIGTVSEPEDDFWEAYYGDVDLRGLTVLDPFVGGGTSVVEARRLGARTVAVDVDPIACSVTNLELMAANLPNLEVVLAHLQATVGKRLRRYHTFVAEDGSEYSVLHHFWVQVVKCMGCGQDFDAHPNFVLAKELKKQWVFCESCGKIESRHSMHKTFSCTACGHRTEANVGRVNFGKVKCPYCFHCEPLIEVSRQSEEAPRWRQFAVEVLGRPDGGRPVPMKERLFFAANSHSDKRYKAATAAYRQRLKSHPATFPDLGISNEKRFDTRLIDYGYRYWTELFNDRQLLHLSLLVEAIQTYDEPIRTSLAMAFSDHLTTNCMLTSYAAGWRRLAPLFSIRAFRHVPRPVELNPWADGSGRGSFPNTVRKLMRAAAYAKVPKEPILNGGFRTVLPVDADVAPMVRCGASQNLSFLKNASVDLVLTDPPYFDNIAYSELAEFFLPWLQLFEVVASDNVAEKVMINSLVGCRGDDKSLEDYTEGLSGVFREVARVLKPSGVMVFSYRHAVPEAWLALANAIAPHPLSAVRVFPAPGEAGVGLHVHKGTGLWDAVFVFRRDANAAEQSCLPLLVTEKQVSDSADQAATWKDTLSGCALSFGSVDEETMRRSSLVATALRRPICKKGGSTALLNALLR